LKLYEAEAVLVGDAVVMDLGVLSGDDIGDDTEDTPERLSSTTMVLLRCHAPPPLS
jgi:hypothetical protein